VKRLKAGTAAANTLRRVTTDNLVYHYISPPIAFAHFTLIDIFQHSEWRRRLSCKAEREVDAGNVRDGWTNIACRFQFTEDNFHLCIGARDTSRCCKARHILRVAFPFPAEAPVVSTRNPFYILRLRISPPF